VYGPLFRIREKIIEPVGEARNDYLIMAGLAERLGYGHLYPQSEEDVLRFVLKGSGFTPEQVRREGGSVSIPPTMMEYRKWEKGRLREDGKPGFATPTGKFEIKSVILEDEGYEPLPTYREPREGPLAHPELAQRFPLVFNSGARLHTGFRSQFHNIPGLLKDNPEPVVELHPRDARPRGIQTGDLVEVHSPRGAVPFRALVTEDIVPGSVECNMGGGTPVGPEAWQSRNVNILTNMEHFDEISGFPVYKALLCQVSKIEGRRRKPIPRPRPPKKVRQRDKPIHSDPVYLDNNATTALAPEVRQALIPFFDQEYGNPSSIHRAGITARRTIQQARRQLAQLVHCRPGEIIFTSGGSEANNLALKGAAFAPHRQGRHIITSAIEHPSVLNTCRFLETQGFQVTTLPVDEDGQVNPADLEAALTGNTFLISIMLANNEVGTIQPIQECARIARRQGILFHTDAVQGVGKIPVDFRELGVDLLSLSGHKFHGPKGAGALVVRKGIRLSALIHGGKQEKNVRGGTENLPGIVGLGAAADLATHRLPEMKAVAELRDSLQRKLLVLFPDARVNGAHRLPNTLNLTIPDLRGESLVLALDQHGLALSSGSACKSGSPDPTHVLLAMGRTPEEAHCSIRLSLSRYTTKTDVRAVITALKQVLREMESTVRFLPCK
ncbi:MAG: IscS subfamily cysteine desulfurase, partial [Fidelibacterota bacterium]